MADIDVAPEKIAALATYLRDHLNPQIWRSARQAGSYGCVPDGFTGLLTPLQEAMAPLSALADELGELTRDRMTSTAAGLVATAESYGYVEDVNTQRMGDPL